ncbi:MAG: hypothetical protein K9M10_01975 [Candidatus Pacebacteria bacterium]|nr:hypothetical protein [Candidatus Paceibacterota bacterium]MCF7857232.1 hypothetical protein [Candidatus Paceibacterota bacterium]
MFLDKNNDYKLLQTLNTPDKIQTFLEKIPFNHELSGETCLSPLRVLRENKAHCIEGAMFAGVCLLLQGEKPLVVNLKVSSKDDYDHVVTIFRRNGYYGAISKTNHAVLRYRDPVYRTLRELVMSYFHEYFLVKNGEKTLLGYTKPINLNRFGKQWIFAKQDLWSIAERIYDTPYLKVIPHQNKKYIRNAQMLERKSADIADWDKKKSARMKPHKI